ncbi:MAG: hypothetical protein J1E03_05980 [Acetatifactor sp.]|nr:hypothetical protein [Acetatifactor sp.]
MQKTVYEDFKYSMQDVSRVYVGCKYSFEELLDDDDLLFKFRLIVERYILPEADPEDTLETHLYYLGPESFVVKLYKRIKARVKVSVIEEKKSLFGKVKRQYVTKQLTMDELVGIPPEEKERQGMVIQELSVSKLALTSV